MATKEADIIGVADIVEFFDLHGRTPYAWVLRGRLPEEDFRVGRALCWHRETIVEWMDGIRAWGDAVAAPADA